MITDHRPHIWELGLRRMIKARATNLNRQVQRFKVPAKPLTQWNTSTWSIGHSALSRNLRWPRPWQTLNSVAYVGEELGHPPLSTKIFWHRKTLGLTPFKILKIVWVLVASENVPSLRNPKIRHWLNSWGDSSCHLPWIPLPHTSCAMTWHVKLVTEVMRWRKLFVDKNRGMALSVHASLLGSYIPTFESKGDFSHFTLWPLWRSNREIRNNKAFDCINWDFR